MANKTASTLVKSKTISLEPFLAKMGRMMYPFWSPVREVYTKQYNPQSCEVQIETSIGLKDYRRLAPAADMASLHAYAQALAGKKIVFVNATYAGGGVAIMRAPLIALLQAAGVDARWFVMKPNEAAFKITKQKFHNVLQDVAGPGIRLTSRDRQIYERWVKDNAHAMAVPLAEADVIVIDDWQPSGLIPFIKGRAGLNPKAKLIFRDHIQSEGQLMSTPGTPQHTTWRYVWEHNQVSKADLLIFHPRDEFVPRNVPDSKVAFMPASSDPLDDLNRPLSAKEVKDGIDFINHQLADNKAQSPLDPKRRYIVLIARFDPSKGMPEGMAAYARARQLMADQGLSAKQLPQLVIAGNGSIDDPDGIPMLQKVMALRTKKYANIKDDIKVARVPHNDVALNALLRGSSLALQPSTKEGFESRVTDAILRGIPVIGSNRGGIPLQIVEGQSGYVIDPADTEQWAQRICQLMAHSKGLKAMRRQTRLLAKSHNYQYTTVPNAISWLYLSTTLLKKGSLNGDRRWVRQMATRKR